MVSPGDPSAPSDSVSGSKASWAWMSAWRSLRAQIVRRRVLIAAIIVICIAWDRAIYLRVAVGANLGDPAAMRQHVHQLESSWVYQFVKLWGEIWPAMMIAVGLILRDWAYFSNRLGTQEVPARKLMRRATIVFLVPALGGILAELVKGLTRRERPIVSLDDAGLGGCLRFRWWWDGPLDWRNLSFVSSHAAVAFGLAFALCALKPRLSMLWLFGAGLCAMSRMLAGAHFLSDVVGGMIVAYAAFLFIYELDRANNPSRPIEGHLV